MLGKRGLGVLEGDFMMEAESLNQTSYWDRQRNKHSRAVGSDAHG